MSIPIPHEKVQLPKIKYAVRASQAVVQYSVGSMIDFPDQTLMLAAPELWSDSVERIHDERLERLLHVNFFGMPGSKDLKQFYQGISYVRFPEWYFCPKCRRLQPIKEWITDYKRVPGNAKKVENDPYMVKHMKCPKCNIGLVVARIVTVCRKGHISDFPWVKWAHMRAKKPICANPKLSLLTSPTAAEGLEGITVACDCCKARASLAGAFYSGAMEQLDIRCEGRHPWKNEKEACWEYPKVMQRGASSVYYPVIESSLVIPPFSSKATIAVENCEKYKELLTSIKSALDTLESLGMRSQDAEQKVKRDNINKSANAIAASTLIPEEQIVKILERKLLFTEEISEEDCETTLSTKYKIEEFEALGSETPNASKDGDFKKEILSIEGYDIPYLKSISLIHKIREVEALVGFTRINPISREGGGRKGDDIVCIKERETNWYPAYQIKGEGVFIEFDSGRLNEWINNNSQIRERANHIDAAYRNSTQSTNRKTAKYIILHTLSHLLIKQLSFECGYGISSLKERIYCSEKEDGKEMAAIFIYTANGDSEGTLGGLVRQGRVDSFPSVFKKAVESAVLCSNDPVCSMSKGQGRDSVNLAACYSCTLIPETSCERNNLCLDRGMIVGTFADNSFGIYSPFLFGKEGWKTGKVTSEALKEEKKDGTDPKFDNSSKIKKLNIKDEGMDFGTVGYSKIWKHFLSFADGEGEKAIYKKFLGMAEQMDEFEKPYQNSILVNEEEGEEIQCDLLWKRAKLLFFSGEEEESYCKAKDTDWKCLSSGMGVSVVDELIKQLKGARH